MTDPLWQPKWHGAVGVTLTCRTTGEYCGYIGSAYPCESQENGWQKAVAWLRNYDTGLDTFLLRTFKIDVRYF